ncbi:tetratricopeptide-like helical domain-containing protein [Artemisia annua]|uniref:Tetratricopeptide-like helical domain-containing protein n=1 Tax=Artemisia annua TaxID=35608 RepID=A0A2U1LLW4_ARTAN|nr:tetratricopeptide-like helical domain-containing protein [Artemisia annua]
MNPNSQMPISSIIDDLMTHFSKSSLYKRVLDMFNHIQQICCEKPSLKAVSTCLNLLVETKQVDLARTFLLDTKHAYDIQFNTCIFNILVKHHCKQGNLESAVEVVKEMKLLELSYPNLITYSTLMEGLCEKGRVEEAINLLDEMVLQRRKFARSERVFNEMKDVGLNLDKVGYTTFINCLCIGGKVAIGILKEMEGKGCKGDSITFNIILAGLCRDDRTYEAFEMLGMLPHEMGGEGDETVGTFLPKLDYIFNVNGRPL